MNHLKNEQSPYLLQHADNPVDWYPWGDEAFEKAKKEDKPIFLSIGYSTCHWCHVMEKESFENPEVAELMNRVFICIKVDREERPDIDNMYMTVCQALTGRGGWPLTILMTPDKKPFFAATYIPRDSRQGFTGLLDLIPAVEKLWKTEREKINASATEIIEAIRSTHPRSSATGISLDMADSAFHSLRNTFDSEYGGFGNAPKFPSPHNFSFLMRYWYRTKNPEALQMVETTLRKMRLGGIYDQIGFGFHRYSTDRAWKTPHFEKMLYDQALMAETYLEMFQITGNDFFAQTAGEIFEYVIRDLKSEEGGFYSAEDADSEGQEGLFYLWSTDELRQILGDQYALFTEFLGIREEGNYRNEATGRFTGNNILFLNEDIQQFAAQHSLAAEEFSKKWHSVREKLLKNRNTRVRPQKDDKVLTDWNGLMISALAKAAWILNDEKYLSFAKEAASFILEKMMLHDGSVLHRYHSGNSGIPGFADDYAFLIKAFIDLYEASMENRWLLEAEKLAVVMEKKFKDAENGGFFQTSSDTEELPLRLKEVYDGALPSANSVMEENLFRLARLLNRSEWEEEARSLQKVFLEQIKRHPAGHTAFLSAAEFGLSTSSEVVLVADLHSDEFMEFITPLRTEYLPTTVFLYKPATSLKLPENNPLAFLNDFEMINGTPTAYVCSGFSCQAPTNDSQVMLEQIRGL